MTTATLPSNTGPGGITDTATDNGQQKSNLAAIRDYLAQLFGTDGTGATARSTLGVEFVGKIAICPFETPPDNWLECDGAELSRTTYATLYAALGTTFGGGDGSTTFNLPDFRGEFLRGWDHGRGVDSGRDLGSAQSEGLKAHTHSYAALAFGVSGGTGIAGGSTFLLGNSSGTSGSTGDAETRPRNVAGMFVIRYQ